MTRSEAEQIAHLLNHNNELSSAYDGNKILRSRAVYLPECYQGLVFGSISVRRLTFMLSEVKHLVVHPAFRGMGLGDSLVRRALHTIDTPLSFATIREDNYPSCHLFEKHGFIKVAVVDLVSHRTWLLVKANVQRRTDNSKSTTDGKALR